MLIKWGLTPLNLYIYKKPKVGRISKNRDGSKKATSPCHDYARSAKEPWLLASNLPNTVNISKKIVKLYFQRMQIEETFRDIKDPRYGFDIRYALSNCKKRISVLMLIASIALLILGVIGKAGYLLGLNRKFQANTVTKELVLSLWYLGQQIYMHMRDTIPIHQLASSFG